jgi:hypothetical protein
MSDPPEKSTRRRSDWLWVVLIAGGITAGEFGLLIATYSRDGTTWRTLHWLDTNTTVTSMLDSPKAPTEVGSPTAGLPIASADPHSNQLAEANKPAVQPEPATTSSLPSQPSQVASVQAGTAPGSGRQSFSAQRGSAARQLDAEEIAALINRGTDSLKSGDLVSARLLLRRAAPSCWMTSGSNVVPSISAALALPASAARVGVVPDVAQARQRYEKAAELGSDGASQRLAKLPQTGQ